MKREATRVREGGRKVWANQDGPGIINCCREIKSSQSFAKINGIMVDLFSANAIIAVHDGINDTQRAKFIALPLAKMASVAFKVLK